LDRGQWLGRFAACPNVPEVPYITKNYLDDVLVSKSPPYPFSEFHGGNQQQENC